MLTNESTGRICAGDSQRCQGTTMKNQIDEKGTLADDGGEGTPVCIKCFQPVDPFVHYCPNCGAATGKFTHYLPFINIRWQVSVWGQAWRQVWSRDVSIPGRLFRLIMIVWNVPIMLIGMLFKSSREIDNVQCQHGTEPDRGENTASG